MIIHILLSFLAGVFTVLTPCVLPVLPVILSGGVLEKSRFRVYVITASLAFSVVLFTVLLRATTLLIDIPLFVWSIISGGIIFVFGLFLLFPQLWGYIVQKTGWYAKTHDHLVRANQKKGIGGMIVLGIALGPVFTSCSPTYAFILATIFPAHFFQGVLYTAVYACGISAVLLVITLLGQRFISYVKKYAQYGKKLKYTVAIILMIMGFLIMTGIDKVLEAQLIESGWVGFKYGDQSILDILEK